MLFFIKNSILVKSPRSALLFTHGINILDTISNITSTSRFSKAKSFTFGSHQSFPLRYGWIEKFCLGIFDKYGSEPFEKDELKPEILSQNYGLGNNMAKSLRFWLKICGIINDNPNSKEKPTLTHFGLKTFGPNGLDPYLEKKETIWHLHYNIISNKKNMSTWGWFFNFYGKQSFDRQQLVNEISEAASFDNKEFSENSIKRDVDCFVRSYLAPSSSSVFTAEDVLECPLTELNLLRKVYGNVLSANRGFQDRIPDELFLLSIENLRTSLDISANTITLETLLNSPFSPGSNFLLSRDALTEKLENISYMSQNSIELDQSSGLAQIVIKNDKYKDIFENYFSNKKAVA